MVGNINQAIQLRKDSKIEESLEIVLGIHQDSPDDPDVDCQIAWTFDRMGNESDAVLCYADNPDQSWV